MGVTKLAWQCLIPCFCFSVTSMRLWLLELCDRELIGAARNQTKPTVRYQHAPCFHVMAHYVVMLSALDTSLPGQIARMGQLEYRDSSRLAPDHNFYQLWPGKTEGSSAPVVARMHALMILRTFWSSLGRVSMARS